MGSLICREIQLNGPTGALFTFMKRIAKNFSIIFYFCHLPLAPQGSTRFVAVTGRPISLLSTLPPCSGIISVDIMYVSTEGARPVVYELIRKKSGSSERSFAVS